MAEELVLDTRPMHTFFRNIGIKVGFMADQFSFRYQTYAHIF